MSEEMSMERFGPVSVDYFVGRRVEKVTTSKEGWTIHVEGNGKIENFDPTIPAPKAIVGAALTQVRLATKSTVLLFGLEQVTLNPIEYAIVDPTYTEGNRIYAQRSEYNMPDNTPPYPSEREAEGPLEPDEDA